MIKRKKKICKRCEKSKYIFSKGRCKECANIEYAKRSQEKAKEKASQTKKKPIAQTEKHKSAKIAERLAMQAYWKTQQDYKGECECAECEKSLGTQFNPYNVAHIISKGANSSFRTDLRNFILLCADHHNQFDGKSRKSMKVYERTEKIRRELKLEDSEKFYNE